MTKNVRLTLTGVQRGESGEEAVTEISCQAEYYCRDGSHYIFYEESAGDETRPETSGGTVKNTVKLRDGVLELRKKGALNSHMVFEPGKRRAALYATPFGALPLEILTERLDVISEESELSCRAEYLLSDGEALISRNTVTLKITSDKK